jgi:hypothetical protein
MRITELETSDLPHAYITIEKKETLHIRSNDGKVNISISTINNEVIVYSAEKISTFDKQNIINIDENIRQRQLKKEAGQ